MLNVKILFDRYCSFSSSSSSGDKDKSSSSSRDKTKVSSSSSSRDKDRHHKSSSSSSKKHSSSSSSSRHKDKDRHHSSSKSGSHGDKDRSHREKEAKPLNATTENSTPIIKEEKMKELKIELKDECAAYLKEEPFTEHENGNETNDRVSMKKEIKEERDSVNMSQASSCDYSMSQFKNDETPFEIKGNLTTGEGDEESQDAEYSQENNVEEDEDDEEDIPIVRYLCIFLRKSY